MGEPVRVVLAGCGGIAASWMDAVRDLPEVRMVGFADPVVSAASGLAARYGWTGAAVGPDLDAVLDATRPDAVFDCAVPEAHVPITLSALRRGCHVLGEKPLADSMAGARRLVAAARSAGRIFAVIQNRRYDARIRRLRAFLESGALGRITTVNADFYLGVRFGGFRDTLRHVLLLDMAIHSFDSARLISGQDAVSVYCHEWNPPASWFEHGASAMAIFEMTGGVVFNYRGSWCSEGLRTAWMCEWRIVGTKGSVRWDGGEGFQAQTADTARGEAIRDVDLPPLESADRVGGHGGLIRDFVRCVRGGGVPETAASDNIRSLAMVFAAIRSAEMRRRVPVRA